MRLVDKLILKELIGPFINGVAMFTMLVFAAGTLFQATKWIVMGVPGLVVARLVVLSLPGIVTQVFPMAMLLAGLMGFGQLSSSRENVALFAAGLSFPRLARPVLAMGVVVTGLAFLWNDYVVPPASTAFWNLEIAAVKKLSQSSRPLAFPIDAPDNKGVEEYVTINGGFDAKNKVARRVNIVKYSSDPKRRGQPQVVVYCDYARFKDQSGVDATYYHGFFTPYVFDAKTGRMDDYVTVHFDELKLLPYGAKIGKSFEDMMKSDVTDTGRLSFRELQHQIQTDRAGGLDTKGKEVDLYGKIALPLASLIFGVVGAALGSNTQRGAGKTVGFGLAIFIVFLYWMFYHSMFVIGSNGGLPPMVASFMADIVGAVAGLILAVRASR